MKKSGRMFGLWAALAIGIGAANAILLKVFELAVNDGTNWLWNDVFHSDVHRWVVVPLAVCLGVVLSMVIRLLRQKRLVSPESDLMAEMNAGPTTLRDIGVILAVGLMSLLAGASLGPEASLMASSAALGAWAIGRYKLGPTGKVMILASIGALLVAFLGSMLMALVPVLFLLKRKQLKVMPVVIVVLASLSSYGMLLIIDHENPGFGTAPPMPQLAEHDFIIALVVGFIATFLALALNQIIDVVYKAAKKFNGKLPWPAMAMVFGLGLGVLYLLGGETIQFSGNVGSHMLLANSAQYGAAALAGLIITKILATAWSKALGYRGGLVFPSIYVGVALGLLVGVLHASWGGAGAMVGGMAGMIGAAVGAPVVAAIFVLAILPVRLLPVALVAIVGSALASQLLKRLKPATPPTSAAIGSRS